MAYVFAFFVLVIILIRLIQKSSSSNNSLAYGGAWGGTASSGSVTRNAVAARGLVLASSQQTTNMRRNGRRYAVRQVRLDVEIPGRPPYEVSLNLLIPKGVGTFGGVLVEALPGDSLELLVDANNPNRVEVLGPGGFTGPWLNPTGYGGGYWQNNNARGWP